MVKKLKVLLLVLGACALCSGIAACATMTPPEEYEAQGYNITVSYDPSIGTDGANIAFNLHIAGIDSTDMSVTIVIPVTVPSGHSIDADSVHAYSIVDEVRQDEYAYASGDSIIIETNHNTPFYVSYEVESDQTFIPFPDDDNDYVPPPPHIVYEDDGSDDSVKIVACAAAAVIAAILAIVLVTTYRRK